MIEIADAIMTLIFAAGCICGLIVGVAIGLWAHKGGDGAARPRID